MTDFINKVITVILIVILLVIGPLNMQGMTDRTIQKIEALNQMSLFLDIVTDKGYIEAEDLDDLSRDMASTGLILNTSIELYRILATEENVVIAKITDVTYDRILENGGRYTINQGYIVRLGVEEIADSTEANLWYRIISVKDTFNEYLSEMRR